MKWLYFAVVALAGATVLLATGRPASAAGTPMTICNRSPLAITITIGYHSSGVNDTAGSNVLTGPFVSRGFAVIAPGKCSSYENPFSARYMFWWPHNEAGLNGMRTIWSDPKINYVTWTTNGNDHYCIPNVNGTYPIDEFTFEDENASEAACEKGHASQNGPNLWVSVRAVDLLVSSTVNFTG
jgi:hypothetical protein